MKREIDTAQSGTAAIFFLLGFCDDEESLGIDTASCVHTLRAMRCVL